MLYGTSKIKENEQIKQNEDKMEVFFDSLRSRWGLVRLYFPVHLTFLTF